VLIFGCEVPTGSHGNAALRQEGTNLIDDAGALADQPLSHPDLKTYAM
jgi:hypothetical protein